MCSIHIACLLEKFKLEHFVQVLMHKPSEMLILDVIWGVRNWDTFSNSLFRVIYAYLTWLLHHV